jgi:adrenodoxin-NADP+ reductase
MRAPIKIHGLYVSGWLARGPTGVIANTMYDAFSTAETIAHDATTFVWGSSKLPDLNRDELAGNKPIVTWADWERIDAEERKRGERLGKEREKFTNVPDMLEVANAR